VEATDQSPPATHALTPDDAAAVSVPAPPADEIQLLLEFLHERDVPCPVCGYNLRNLTQARCPECEQKLRLAVGVFKLQIGWLLATITPCTFSGIAAALLLIPIIFVPATGGGSAPWPALAIDAFGWLSALAGLAVFNRRWRFLARPVSTQRIWTIIMWAIHITAFILVLSLSR